MLITGESFWGSLVAGSLSHAESSPAHTRTANVKRGLKILIVTNIKIMVLQKYDKNNKKENISTSFLFTLWFLLFISVAILPNILR
jgi:hypothetical protein